LILVKRAARRRFRLALMTMLDLARGPLLTMSLTVFFAGTLWRLWSLWRLGSRPSLAAPRAAAVGWKTVFTRMLPHRGLPASARLATINPYLYHLGLALVVFGYRPHIAFIERLTGLAWPALPDAVMYLAAGVTIVSLLVALLYRLTDPVLRLISGAGDYFAWIVVMLPMLTGMALISGDAPDPGRLGLHLLSLELLLAWFPFGKLMHAFLFAPGRWQLGAFLSRRGVRP
jgi:nitrate reductase gamma subunit